MGKLKVSKAASKFRAGKASLPARNSVPESLLAQMSLLAVELSPPNSPAGNGCEGNRQITSNGASHAAAINGARQISTQSLAHPGIPAKIKELVRLAQE